MCAGKTLRSTLRVVAVAVLGCVPPLHASAQRSTGAPDETEAFVRSGCAACHGSSGQGTLAAPSIAARARGLEEFIAYVRHPAAAMPPVDAQAVSDDLLASFYAQLYPAAAEAAAAAQTAAAAGRAAVGAALFYRDGCFECHANEGQGGTQGPRIGPNPIPYARFAWYVRNPTGEMPPYTVGVMSDQELADVYAFLRARPQPAPVDDIALLAP
jgi:ubiquinol-cytochrome c reductase cytochrome c subunit